MRARLAEGRVIVYKSSGGGVDKTGGLLEHLFWTGILKQEKEKGQTQDNLHLALVHPAKIRIMTIKRPENLFYPRYTKGYAETNNLKI